MRVSFKSFFCFKSRRRYWMIILIPQGEFEESTALKEWEQPMSVLTSYIRVSLVQSFLEVRVIVWLTVLFSYCLTFCYILFYSSFKNMKHVSFIKCLLISLEISCMFFNMSIQNWNFLWSRRSMMKIRSQCVMNKHLRVVNKVWRRHFGASLDCILISIKVKSKRGRWKTFQTWEKEKVGLLYNKKKDEYWYIGV